LNAVPTTCEIYLDRRTVIGETEDQIKAEMDSLIAGKNANWAVGTIHRKSWTGLEIVYEPFHNPWKIELDHPLTQASIKAYQKTFGTHPPSFRYWDFSTNAVATVPLRIPTIGFGPGDPGLAHMKNESCETEQIYDAYRFYLELIQSI